MEAALLSFFAKGTPSGWTLCILALVGVILLTKIVLNQRPKMKELEITESGALRTAFVAEMTALRDEITRLRDETTGLRDETKELRTENGALRKEVASLHSIIDGMRREALTGQLATQAAVARSMGEQVPEATRAALDRLNAIPGVNE